MAENIVPPKQHYVTIVIVSILVFSCQHLVQSKASHKCQYGCFSLCVGFFCFGGAQSFSHSLSSSLDSTFTWHYPEGLSACGSLPEQKNSLFDKTLKQVVLYYSLIYTSSFLCFTVATKKTRKKLLIRQRNIEHFNESNTFTYSLLNPLTHIPPDG